MCFMWGEQADDIPYLVTHGDLGSNTKPQVIQRGRGVTHGLTQDLSTSDFLISFSVPEAGSDLKRKPPMQCSAWLRLKPAAYYRAVIGLKLRQDYREKTFSFRCLDVCVFVGVDSQIQTHSVILDTG